MNATHVLAILTIHTDNLPENFQDIIKHEKEVVAAWKTEGILDQLFLRPTRNGAILIFKNLTEEEVNEKMKTLPLYPLMKSLEVLLLIADTAI
jgi:muconolactone D-isomerase